jgi:RNA polymerase sigma factor (sigma-70 family)
MWQDVRANVESSTIEGVNPMLSTNHLADSPANTAGFEPPSFEELFAKYYGRLVAVLQRLVGERQQAEDLASDVFLRFYRRPPAPDPDGNLGGWLYRTACNLGLDALRANARRKQYELSAARTRLEGQFQTSPLEDVLREEKRRRVSSVLAALKPAQSQILVLRSNGLSYKELAAVLGVKLGSVGTMLLRSEEAFRNRYVRMYGNEEEL